MLGAEEASRAGLECQAAETSLQRPPAHGAMGPGRWAVEVSQQSASVELSKQPARVGSLAVACTSVLGRGTRAWKLPLNLLA